MRRGSLNAAEEITGHKYETLGDWLRRAAAHAEAITACGPTQLQSTRRGSRCLLVLCQKKHSPPATPDGAPVDASRQPAAPATVADGGTTLGWVSPMDRPTRLIVAWALRPRKMKPHRQWSPVITRQRTAGAHRRPAWCAAPGVSDGKTIYRQAVAKTYRDPVHTGKRGPTAIATDGWRRSDPGNQAPAGPPPGQGRNPSGLWRGARRAVHGA